MTAERAIELLANMELAEKHQGDDETQEAIHEAMDALEWHIAAQPEKTVDGRVLCSKCYSRVALGESYCWDCGKAIDWSEYDS